MMNQPVNEVVPELRCVAPLVDARAALKLWGRCCENDDLYDAVAELHGLELDWEEW